MPDTEFTYKGKKIVIREEHPGAVITIDGRKFSCHHHHPKDDQGLAMWMCDEAYFSSPDIREMAKHFADYGYMYDDPGRVVVNDEGQIVKTGGGSGSGGQGGHGGHGEGGGHEHGDRAGRRGKRGR